MKCLITLTANQDWAAQEQNLRIFNLQLERERLKRRQQEIAKLNVSWRLEQMLRLKILNFFIFQIDRRRSIPTWNDRSHTTGER